MWDPYLRALYSNHIWWAQVRELSASWTLRGILRRRVHRTGEYGQRQPWHKTHLTQRVFLAVWSQVCSGNGVSGQKGLLCRVRRTGFHSSCDAYTTVVVYRYTPLNNIKAPTQPAHGPTYDGLSLSHPPTYRHPIAPSRHIPWIGPLQASLTTARTGSLQYYIKD